MQIKKKKYIPFMSSTETNDGCNNTAAWISLDFASSVTTLADIKMKYSTFCEFNF